MRNFRADPNAIYFTDNGATLCGEHLGMTAKMTGRDISGQTIERVTPEDVQNWNLDYADLGPIKCESCGKVASALHTAAA